MMRKAIESSSAIVNTQVQLFITRFDLNKKKGEIIYSTTKY